MAKAWIVGAVEEMSYRAATEANQVFMVTSISDVDCGGGNHVFNLTTGLLQRGCDVQAVCFEAGSLLNELTKAGVPTRICPIRRKSDWQGWMSLRHLLRTERPRMVHSHGERGTVMASWAAWCAGVPVIISTLHRSVPQTASWSWPLRQLYTLIEDWTLRLANTALVTVSESLRSDLIEQRAHDPKKIAAIPNGTPIPEPDVIARLRQQSADLRRRMELADDAYVIGTVGRLVREKGAQYAIEAMTRVLEHLPHAFLVIVGDGSYRDALAGLVGELHLESRVRFAGHQKDVKPWLALFDLFVLPTPWEAFGLAMIEAMSFSIPVVATNRGGPADIIQDQRSGMLVPPFDSEALAWAIIGLGKDPERARWIGSCGYEMVKQCYSIDKMVDATLAFYDEQKSKRQV